MTQFRRLTTDLAYFKASSQTDKAIGTEKLMSTLETSFPYLDGCRILLPAPPKNEWQLYENEYRLEDFLPRYKHHPEEPSAKKSKTEHASTKSIANLSTKRVAKLAQKKRMLRSRIFVVKNE